ncbi:MAG TPA: hypothetical protein VEB20_06465 [Azospirillaceae bacterium]|nr:hypothetical protein [Azospirillaceae bacterium]
MQPSETPLKDAAALLKREDAKAAEAAAEPSAADPGLTALLSAMNRELALARQRTEELHARLAEAERQRADLAARLAEAERRRDGLQFKLDYLEEKLDQAKRELSRRRPWLSRLTSRG